MDKYASPSLVWKALFWYNSMKNYSLKPRRGGQRGARRPAGDSTTRLLFVYLRLAAPQAFIGWNLYSGVVGPRQTCAPRAARPAGAFTPTIKKGFLRLLAVFCFLVFKGEAYLFKNVIL